MATRSAFNESGLAIKAVVNNAALQFADVVGEALESYNAANIDNYDIACTEIGSTGQYYMTWPAWLPVGTYMVQFVPLAGASIAESDFINRFGVGNWYYDGVNLFPDWAVKLAQSAAPVAGSVEATVATNLDAKSSVILAAAVGAATPAQVTAAAQYVVGTQPANFALLVINSVGKVFLATNAITSGVVDTDAIGASELSAAACTKIANAVITRQAGPGGIATTIVCQRAGLAVDGVEVWISDDDKGTNVIAGTLVSNAQGKAVFMLEEDAGPFYAWRQKAGLNWPNPIVLVWNSAKNIYEAEA